MINHHTMNKNIVIAGPDKHRSIVTATQEVEAGESKFECLLVLYSEFKCSLGNLVMPYLKTKGVNKARNPVQYYSACLPHVRPLLKSLTAQKLKKKSQKLG